MFVRIKYIPVNRLRNHTDLHPANLSKVRVFKLEFCIYINTHKNILIVC